MGDDAPAAAGELTALTHRLGAAAYSPRTAEVIAERLRRKVIDGELKDGDFLPTETTLMGQLEVSRSTLRQAIRLLEVERFLEVRPGSRSGARVRIPGPEALARPAGFLLEMSAASVADVLAARSHLEHAAVGLLAERADAEAIGELDALLRGRIRSSWETGQLTQFASEFGRRTVELSGSATLVLMVGMLDEITARHIASRTRPRRRIRGQNSTPSEPPTPISSSTSAPAMSPWRNGIGDTTCRNSAASSPTTTDGRRYAVSD